MYNVRVKHFVNIETRGLPAFKARARSGTNELAKLIKFSLNLAPFYCYLIFVLMSNCQGGVEALGYSGQNSLHLLDRILPRDIVCHLSNGAFIARAAKSRNGFLYTSRDRRWARLLKANYVAAEAEAEITVILARDLLGGYIYFAVEEAC